MSSRAEAIEAIVRRGVPRPAVERVLTGFAEAGFTLVENERLAELAARSAELRGFTAGPMFWWPNHEYAAGDEIVREEAVPQGWLARVLRRPRSLRRQRWRARG